MMIFRMAVLALCLTTFRAAAEERYLLPVFTDVPGAHGAMFASSLALHNQQDVPATVRGLEFGCLILCPPTNRTFSADPGTTYMNFAKVGHPGLIVKTPDGSRIRMNLRVSDTSRGDLSAGTEIPIVRETEMGAGPVLLLAVPPEGSQFRSRLRIYSFSAGMARALFIRESDNAILHQVTLELMQPWVESADMLEFYPAFAETADFPVTGSRIRVQVEGVSGLDRLWAFVTTTNNITQEITVVSPQP